MGEHKMKIFIFGAKSIAIGICNAVRILQPEIHIIGFLVTSLIDNPQELEGLPVRELKEVCQKIRQGRKQKGLFLYSGAGDAFLQKT